MSTYSKVTRHPQTGKWEIAEWIDDYFGHHIYGVQFESDKKVYPTELVEQKDIKNFWAEDVRNAFSEYLKDVFWEESNEEIELQTFLNLIEQEYKKRWKEDPVFGANAVLPND